MLTGKVMGAGGVGGAAPDPAWLYTSKRTGSGTFTSVPFGDEHSSRFIIVGIQIDRNATTTISAVTIGGVSATRITNSPSGTWYEISMWGAFVPTGTSGSIAVTISAAHEFAIQVIGTYVSSATPTATAYVGDTDPSNVSVNTSGSNALVVTFGGYYTPSHSFVSLTGATVTTASPSTTYVNWILYGGLAFGLSAETPRTISWDWNSGGFGLRCISASFEGA